jgi:hypothetical protein
MSINDLETCGYCQKPVTDGHEHYRIISGLRWLSVRIEDASVFTLRAAGHGEWRIEEGFESFSQSRFILEAMRSDQVADFLALLSPDKLEPCKF